MGPLAGGVAEALGAMVRPAGLMGHHRAHLYLRRALSLAQPPVVLARHVNHAGAMPLGAVSILMRAEFLNVWEVVLILAVILILWGAKTLHDPTDNLRRWFKEFKKWLSNAAHEEFRKWLRSWADDSGAALGRENRAADAPLRASRSTADALALWLVP